MDQSKDTRKKEFDEKFHNLLVEFSDILGPLVCSIHGEEPCDCPNENLERREGWAIPVDWVAMSLWIDSGENSYLDIAAPLGQPGTRTLGLLVAARDNF